MDHRARALFGAPGKFVEPAVCDQKRPRGRPSKAKEPTPLSRMIDALIIRMHSFDDLDCARTILRRAGFHELEVIAMGDMALAAARKRVSKR